MATTININGVGNTANSGFDMLEAEDNKVIVKRPMRELTGKERSHLRGLAHQLTPVIQVGKEGVHEGLVAQAVQALETHELIKVRVLASAGVSSKVMGLALADKAGAHLAGTLGKVAILYRRRRQKPGIKF